jgi:DNA-binding transcriptional MerR regulator
MSIFDEFKGFWGTGAELTERAKVLSKAMGLKSEKLTERLIRYYAAEGVLDKPDRLGREAAYHFRHLLQLLIARRLVDEGVTLIAISKFNLNKSTEELEQALLKPSKDEAKAVTEEYRGELVKPNELLLVKAHPDSMSDVLSQIKELKQNIDEEAQELQKTRYQIESLLENLTETQYAFYKRMENEQLEMRHMVMSTLERMLQMVERQRMEFDDQMSMMKKQAASAQEEVLFLLSKLQELRLPSK